MKKMQRFVCLAAISSSLIAAGCDRDSTDAAQAAQVILPATQPSPRPASRVQDELVGSWEWTVTGPVTVRGETTFTADRHFIFSAKVVGTNVDIWASGTWEIESNNLIEHVKETNSPNIIRIGPAVQLIVGLTGDEFEYINTNSKKRFVSHRIQTDKSKTDSASTHDQHNS